MNRMKRITIIGTGFAALTAVRKLRAQDAGAEISVIGRKAEFVCLPTGGTGIDRSVEGRARQLK